MENVVNLYLPLEILGEVDPKINVPFEIQWDIPPEVKSCLDFGIFWDQLNLDSLCIFMDVTVETSSSNITKYNRKITWVLQKHLGFKLITPTTFCTVVITLLTPTMHYYKKKSFKITEYICCLFYPAMLTLFHLHPFFYTFFRHEMVVLKKCEALSLKFAFDNNTHCFSTY